GPMTVTVYTFLFALIGSLPLGKPVETVRLLAEEPSLLLWTGGIALVSTAAPYFFYTWGLARMEAGKAAILVAVEPLVGALIGILVFHEGHGPLKLLGILLILAAVIILNLPRRKKEKPV
ncbi:MAG: DMT family transporter, partial [Clostridia bacterium]|nr:DMT family transporter [Clostridia bacterium]